MSLQSVWQAMVAGVEFGLRRFEERITRSRDLLGLRAFGRDVLGLSDREVDEVLEAWGAHPRSGPVWPWDPPVIKAAMVERACCLPWQPRNVDLSVFDAGRVAQSVGDPTCRGCMFPGKLPHKSDHRPPIQFPKAGI